MSLIKQGSGVYKLVDGLFLVTDGDDVRIISLGTGSVTDCPDSDKNCLLDVAMCCEGLHPATTYDRLRKAGIIEKSDNKVDAQFCSNLADLDRQFSWMFNEEDTCLYAMALELHSSRKEISETYSQGPCLPETAFRRAKLIAKEAKGKRVMLLGDDDLVGLLLAQLGFSVTIADIHKRLLSFIRHYAQKWQLNVRLIEADFTTSKSIAPNLSQSMDLVMIDPVSSKYWFAKAFDIAADYLRTEGDLFLVVYENKEGQLNEVLAESCFEQESCLRKFNHYYSLGAEIDYLPSYDSHIYVLRKKLARNEWTEPLTDEMIFRPDMQYAYDFYHCSLIETQHDTAQKIMNGISTILKMEGYEWVEKAQQGYYNFYLTNAIASVNLYIYELERYCGLTVRLYFSGNIHQKVLQLCSRYLAYEKVKISEHSRFS